MRIYLAGPLGFSEAGRDYYYGTIVPRLTGLGHTILDPWALTDHVKFERVRDLAYGAERRRAWELLNDEIVSNNRKAMDACDAMFAILDGVNVDSGTAAEIGYGFAKDKPILGYRGDFRLCADNEGSIVNLTVEYFIRRSGGDIITSLADLSPGLDLLSVALAAREPS